MKSHQAEKNADQDQQLHLVLLKKNQVDSYHAPCSHTKILKYEEFRVCVFTCK